MTTTQPTLRDLLMIRDYLRERRDDPSTTAATASVLSAEVLRLNDAINKAEAEAES